MFIPDADCCLHSLVELSRLRLRLTPGVWNGGSSPLRKVIEWALAALVGLDLAATTNDGCASRGRGRFGRGFILGDSGAKAATPHTDKKRPDVIVIAFCGKRHWWLWRDSWGARRVLAKSGIPTFRGHASPIPNGRTGVPGEQALSPLRAGHFFDILSSLSALILFAHAPDELSGLGWEDPARPPRRPDGRGVGRLQLRSRRLGFGQHLRRLLPAAHHGRHGR
jgi:hypothetical protein